MRRGAPRRGGPPEELQFERYRGYRVEELSGGTRQKLNLALALMHEPELLLLDEPYAGFDWETYLHFWEMSERRRDAGMGILIVSHLLAERDRLDRIYSLATADGDRVSGLADVGRQLPARAGPRAAEPRPAGRDPGLLRPHLRQRARRVRQGSRRRPRRQAATAISAGWAAAFLCGALAFFQVVSSREADRRLALAGLGPWRVAISRIAAALALGLIVSLVAYVTLWLRSGVAHPLHAAAAIFFFAASTSASAP